MRVSDEPLINAARERFALQDYEVLPDAPAALVAAPAAAPVAAGGSSAAATP